MGPGDRREGGGYYPADPEREADSHFQVLAVVCLHGLIASAVGWVKACGNVWSDHCLLKREIREETSQRSPGPTPQ